MSSIKRIFDIVFSIFALMIFFPFGVIIALLIKIFSPGPLFYSSKRVGKAGKEIYCWKFRTMCTDAEEKLSVILNSCPKLKAEWDAFYKLKKDPRVNCIGRFLRKTSLDEFPQFWNVIKGDLSVVGPRPVTREELQKYFGNKTEKVLSVRPGLTGIWQTSGRSLVSFEDRVLMEERYIDTQSFFLDLRIIFKTVLSLIWSRGAF